MFKFLPGPVKGLIAATLFAINTMFWCLLIYIAALVRGFFQLMGYRSGAKSCVNLMAMMGENWISFNSFEISLMHRIEWHTTGLEHLKKDASYLICANHQSWVDIVILQHVFNRQIPFLRFFLKRELIYVPFLGVAWWALDFPFMKRYSKSYLERHPEKRGEDLKTTRQACERFRGSKISILNFLEGTRFTAAKHKKQCERKIDPLQPSYLNLLTPKIGGLAYVLEVMGNQFDSVLDVTIFYPEGGVSLWGLFSGRLNEVEVHVKRIEIPTELLKGRYQEDVSFRQQMQSWVHDFWTAKDNCLSEAKNRRRPR